MALAMVHCILNLLSIFLIVRELRNMQRLLTGPKINNKKHRNKNHESNLFNLQHLLIVLEMHYYSLHFPQDY